MKTLCACFVLLAVWSAHAFAGGRGSHNTTFDPNSYGGGWTTINCTGTDNAAFDSWRTAAVAANPALAKLRITGTCVITADKQITTGITNAIIWAYGSTITRPYIGAGAVGTAYKIGGATIGQTTVTLQTIGDAANFTVGGWVLVSGLQNQSTDCGFPTNPSFFDWVLITNVNAGTGVLTFAPPLTEDYLITWPDTNCSGGQPNVIPQTAAWDTNVQVFGMNIASVGQVVVTGRTMAIHDTTFGPGGIDPTISDTISVFNSEIQSSEVDKNTNSITLYNVHGRILAVQSGSVKKLLVVNLKMDDLGNGIPGFKGTTGNTTILNSTIPNLWLGPYGYGHGKSIVVDNLTIRWPIVSGLQYINRSAVTCSAGIISLAKTDPSISIFLHMGVPGAKYAIADNNFFGTRSIPEISFTISGITDDGTNINWATNLDCSLNPVCGFTICTKYVSYPAATIIQRFTPGVNLTQYAAP